MKAILTVLFALVGFITFKKLIGNKKWKTPTKPFPSAWRTVLLKCVNFYNALSQKEREQFEFKVYEFLLNTRIVGIKTTVNDEDRVLVAASAIIPIFAFPNWSYTNLFEVQLFPSSFNEKFDTSGDDRNILGMVGTGYMEGKMVLSKKALHLGFDNASDKKNTAIHEFVHLIDKLDGSIDGVPSLLLDKQYTLPWLDLVKQKIHDIYEDESDINPYGATNEAEFLSVISEYFFERPKLLQAKHPELYESLSKMFNQDMQSRSLAQQRYSISRNSPCPCESGKKYKKCCGRA